MVTEGKKKTLLSALLPITNETYADMCWLRQAISELLILGKKIVTHPEEEKEVKQRGGKVPEIIEESRVGFNRVRGGVGGVEKM